MLHDFRLQEIKLFKKVSMQKQWSTIQLLWHAMENHGLSLLFVFAIERLPPKLWVILLMPLQIVAEPLLWTHTIPRFVYILFWCVFLIYLVAY
jgi:hypothetical protein